MSCIKTNTFYLTLVQYFYVSIFSAYNKLLNLNIFRYKNSVDEFNSNHKFEQGESSKKAKLLKFYGKEM